MKIKTKVLSDFLKKVNLNGSVREFVVDFNEDGVVVIANNNENTALLQAMLKKESFIEYEVLGKVAFMNVDKIIAVINSFSTDDVEMSVEGNLLLFKSGNRKVETELANIATVKVPKFEADKFTDMTPIKFSADFFNELVGDCSINKEYFFKLRIQEEKLIIQSTGVFRFTETILLPGLKQVMKVDFGSPFIDAFKALGGEVTLNLKDAYPAYIIEETDLGKVEILVAPRIVTE